MKNYELIEHTADVGIKVKGKDLKRLFKNTALAMFDIIAEKKPETRARKSEKRTIKQKAGDLEELFVNWLNELLSSSAAEGLIFTNFIICRLDKNNIEADVVAQDIGDYKVNTEIKAATYHELKLGQVKGGWQAEVIFDV
ncbi:MAG: archease [Candidatus Omnitrophota bacterium]|nr:archease [Candidatus Omnitrophota bacterium]